MEHIDCHVTKNITNPHGSAISLSGCGAVEEGDTASEEEDVYNHRCVTTRDGKSDSTPS